MRETMSLKMMYSLAFPKANCWHMPRDHGGSKGSKLGNGVTTIRFLTAKLFKACSTTDLSRRVCATLSWSRCNLWGLCP